MISVDLQELLEEAFILAAPYLSNIAFIRDKIKEFSAFSDKLELIEYISQIEQEAAQGHRE